MVVLDSFANILILQGANFFSFQFLLNMFYKTADLWRRLWPAPIIVDKKLFGHAEDLKRTAVFMNENKIPV
jgi:hypothetical protein